MERMGSTKAEEFVPLKETEEFDLGLGRKLFNSFKKEGIFPFLKMTNPTCRHRFEGALIKTALKETFLKGTTVHGDDRPFGAGAQLVYQPREELLPRTAFPLQRTGARLAATLLAILIREFIP